MRLGLWLCGVLLLGCNRPSRSDCEAMVRRNFKIFWGTDQLSKTDLDREVAKCLRRTPAEVRCMSTVEKVGDFGDCLIPGHRERRAKGRAFLVGQGCDPSTFDLMSSGDDAGVRGPLRVTFGFEPVGELDCGGAGPCRCATAECSARLAERCQNAASDSQMASDAGPTSSTPEVTHE